MGGRHLDPLERLVLGRADGDGPPPLALHALPACDSRPARRRPPGRPQARALRGVPDPERAPLPGARRRAAREPARRRPRALPGRAVRGQRRAPPVVRARAGRQGERLADRRVGRGGGPGAPRRPHAALQTTTCLTRRRSSRRPRASPSHRARPAISAHISSTRARGMSSSVARRRSESANAPSIPSTPSPPSRRRSSSVNCAMASSAGSACSAPSASASPRSSSNHMAVGSDSNRRATHTRARWRRRAPRVVNGTTRSRAKLTARHAWGMPLRRMRSIPWSAGALVLATLAAAGCQQSKESGGATPATPGAQSAAGEAGGEVVATYQGHTLTSGRVAQEFERLPAPSRTYLAAPERKRQFVENLVVNDLLYAEGAQAGYDKDAEITRQVDDLGTFSPGRMVPEFDKVAFALQPGELSDVVKTQYGYHIIMVAERKDGEPKPFDQVKEQIRAALRNKTIQDQVQGHLDELKKSADLKVDENALARITPPAPAPQATLPGAPPQPNRP